MSRHGFIPTSSIIYVLVFCLFGFNYYKHLNFCQFEVSHENLKNFIISLHMHWPPRSNLIIFFLTLLECVYALWFISLISEARNQQQCLAFIQTESFFLQY